MARDTALLRDRRFTVLLAARSASVLGSSFAPVAVAFGVLGLPGATAGTLSIVLAAEAVPLVLFLLIGGVIADRFRRHLVIMVAEVLTAVAYGSLAVMLLSGWTPLPALAGAMVFAGLSSALMFPALTGIIPDVVPPDHLHAGNALLGLSANVARIAGTVLSGAAVALIGAGWALVASAVMFVVAAVVISALKLPAGTNGPSGDSVLRELRDGWQEFRSRQWLWVVVAQFSVLVMAIQAAHGVLGPVVADTELGGAPAWSAVLAGEAVGTIVGVLIALRIRPRRPILAATYFSAAPAALYFLLGVGAPLWALVGAAVLMGISFDIFGVLWQTTMQREIPPAALSRVSSYDAFGSTAFGPIGLLLAGPAAALVGAHTALIWCAGITVVMMLLALSAPGVRRLRAPEEPAELPASAAVSGVDNRVPLPGHAPSSSGTPSWTQNECNQSQSDPIGSPPDQQRATKAHRDDGTRDSAGHPDVDTHSAGNMGP